MRPNTTCARLAASTIAAALLAAACTNNNSADAGVEMLDPVTGEVTNVDLVEAEPVGGDINTEPDTAHPWPNDYLEASGAVVAELDEWAAGACDNITLLPESPASIAAVMNASDTIPPETLAWPRAALVDTVINRWCPVFAESIEAAVAVMGGVDDGPPAVIGVDGEPVNNDNNDSGSVGEGSPDGPPALTEDDGPAVPDTNADTNGDQGDGEG